MKFRKLKFLAEMGFILTFKVINVVFFLFYFFMFIHLFLNS